MRVCVRCGHTTEADTCPHDGLPTIPAEAAPFEGGRPDVMGRVVGDRYVVGEPLGDGGMGWVYAATHKLTGHDVAVKFMRRQLVREREAMERFLLEARATSRLKQPHTIQVHDFGVTEEGYPYLVMERLVGETLRDRLKAQGRLQPLDAIRTAAQVCKSLIEAHGAGLVHRDLKPPNIWCAEVPGEELFVKVLDFGLVKVVHDDSSLHGDPGTLTRSGAVMGTPRYMAPEQLAELRLDARCDLYALGTILYEMLTGRPPYDATTVAGLAQQRVAGPPPPLGELAGDVPRPLIRFVDDLMQPAPVDRPRDATEALGRLEELERAALLSGPSSGKPRAQRGHRWLLGLVALLAAFAAVVVLRPHANHDPAPVPVRVAPARSPESAETAAAPATDVAAATPAPDASAPAPAPDATAPTARPDATPAAPAPDAAPDSRAAETHGVVVRPTLRSAPSGATVYHGSRRLGRTPLELEGPRGEVQQFTVRRRGYRPETVRVEFGEEPATVRLKEQRRRQPTPEPKPEPKPEPEPKPKPPKIRMFD